MVHDTDLADLLRWLRSNSPALETAAGASRQGLTVAGRARTSPTP
jgi:hypothetical protein